jgi:hypothetical protein
MAKASTSRNNPLVLGYFLFQDLLDGCLGSKYSNTIHTTLFGECAVRRVGALADERDVFIGTYDTAWLEQVPGNPMEAVRSFLKIERKRLSAGQYSLTWTDSTPPHDVLFWGEGMRCGEFLVGCYWGNAVNNLLGPQPQN